MRQGKHRILIGDVLGGLRSLPDGCVRCCVTSPPYWGLRDYGTASWEGGDAACDHDQRRRERDPDSKEGEYGGKARDSLAGQPQCRKCGARRIDRQIGLESTPEAYIERMVGVFREVRRVLADDGTAFVNIGDSYAAGAGGRGDVGNIIAGVQTRTVKVGNGRIKREMPAGLKPKDLVGIPWMLAFALRADGWYLRSDIIWAKPNPMPESVTDRPTKAHEYVFLLSKRERYFYDAEAVKEPLAWPEDRRAPVGTLDGHQRPSSAGREPGKKMPPIGGIKHAELGGTKSGEVRDWPSGRNTRTVWTIATQPYPESHFATFPEALPERCVKAGSSERGKCPACGAAWVRKVERESRPNWQGDDIQKHDGTYYRPNIGGGVGNDRRASIVLGWEPTCTHGHDPIPDTVLDPFAGSGTTLLVACRLGRNAIGCELNPEYAEMAERRIGSGLRPATFRDESVVGGDGLFAREIA